MIETSRISIIGKYSNHLLHAWPVPAGIRIHCEYETPVDRDAVCLRILAYIEGDEKCLVYRNDISRKTIQDCNYNQLASYIRMQVWLAFDHVLEDILNYLKGGVR